MVATDLVFNELSAKSLLSSSPSIISNSTSSISETLLRKTKFDDRATTKTSLALKSYRNNGNQTSRISTLNEPQPNGGGGSGEDDEILLKDIFQWNELKTISDTINSPEFINLHGSRLFVKSNAVYIAIITNRGNIVIFNYRQEIDYILVPTQSTDENCSISCIAFSSDCSYLAAGLQDGSIRLWNLKKATKGNHIPNLPFYTIYPISLKSRFAQNVQGHVINTKITYISFVGESNCQLITADDCGLVFFHNGIKKFMNLIYVTTKLLGKNDANLDDSKFKIRRMEMLPLGSAHQITDKMGIVAIMTDDLLVIVSAISLNDDTVLYVKQHFKIGKPKHIIHEQDFPSYCLSWMPSIQTKTGVTNIRLAYCWNNILTILELDNKSVSGRILDFINNAKDKNKVISKLPFKKIARLTDERIIRDIKWLQSDILCVFLDNEMITIYSNGTMLVPVASQTIGNISDINLSKHRVIYTDESKLFIGKLLGWADILLNKLSQGLYAEALSIADNYYNSNSVGKLTVVGLPQNQKQRGDLIEPYLIKIMREAMPHLIQSDHESYITLCLNIIAYLAVPNDLLEALYEIVQDNSIFFQALEPFILSGLILSLPPVVLKALIQYYVKAENQQSTNMDDDGELLTEIICTLDIKLLDIDLTIQLCKQYNLRECLVYVWNFVLNDYQTPLVDFFVDIKKNPSSPDNFKVYTYLSYILTGSQYPIDKFINNDRVAKKTICDILFSSSTISSVPTENGNTIFPYLYTLLKFDSLEMLSCLNEFFEDLFLNEDPKLNRQYLIEALIDIFEANDEQFTDFDKCQLLIFIARNYPKYSQFLRLSDSILSDVFNRLCENKSESIFLDCELALQSLLPYFEPEDEYYVEKLEKAKYYNVLINMYKSEGMFSQALKMWLKREHENASEDTLDNETPEMDIDGGSDDHDHDHVDQLYLLLESSFASSKNPSDRLNLVKIVKDNFGKFLKLNYVSDYNISRFVNLIEQFSPNLHLEVLKLTSSSDKTDVDNEIVLSYLREVFLISKSVDLTQFINRYIELLLLYKKDKEVISFVKQWKDKVDYDVVMLLFKNHNAIEPQVILLIDHKKSSVALELILKYVEDNVNDTSLQEEFTNLLDLAIAICENPKNHVTSEVRADELKLNEKLWLELITRLVVLVNSSNIVAGSQIYQFFNQFIHDCFKRISDHKLNNDSKSLFLNVFNKFLHQFPEDDPTKFATLANIKDVLQQVFISYSYESEILKITMRMFNRDMYKNMMLLQDIKLAKWDITTKNCANCGKPMWGKHIDTEDLNQHWLAWENCQKQKLWGNGKDDTFDDLKLIFFSCGHGYHYNCLERLGVNDYCVICGKK